MGCGYGANFAIVIDLEKIEEMNLGSWVNFKRVLKENKVPLENYAMSTKYGDYIYDEDGEEVENPEHLDSLFQHFQKEFKAHTGIGIDISYHSIDNEGDRYDEVNGVYFSLNFDDVYHLTPQAKLLQERANFDMRFFVNFG